MATFEQLERDNTKLLDEYAKMEEPTLAFKQKIRTWVASLGKTYGDINEDVAGRKPSAAVSEQREHMRKISLWMRTWGKVLS